MTLVWHSGEALYAVKQIRRLKPCVAQMVYAEQAFCAFMLKEQYAFGGRTAEHAELYAGVSEHFFNSSTFCIFHLDYDSRILGK